MTFRRRPPLSVFTGGLAPLAETFSRRGAFARPDRRGRAAKRRADTEVAGKTIFADTEVAGKAIFAGKRRSPREFFPRAAPSFMPRAAGAGRPYKLPSLICKPGSVVCGHLSRRIVADALKRCSRRTPGEQPWRHAPNLAPDGVCTARRVTAAPVSSYLPFPSLQQKAAVCFCCTFLGVASTGRYPASCSMVPGLSSRQKAARPHDQLGLIIVTHGARIVNSFFSGGRSIFLTKHL